MQNPNLVSCWDEPITPATNTVAVAQASNAASSMQLQLVGILGVLAVVAAVTVSVAVAVTSAETSTTTYLMISTTTTTETTVTTTTRPPQPYACGNMTCLNNTDYPGNDLAPSPTMNYTACCDFCLNTTICVAFSWITGPSVCYRKSSLGSGPVNTSGIISSRY